MEFLNKESAELALSVNGTSFMSRIVKVTKFSYKTDIFKFEKTGTNFWFWMWCRWLKGIHMKQPNFWVGLEAEGSVLHLVCIQGELLLEAVLP